MRPMNLLSFIGCIMKLSQCFAKSSIISSYHKRYKSFSVCLSFGLTSSVVFVSVVANLYNITTAFGHEYPPPPIFSPTSLMTIILTRSIRHTCTCTFIYMYVQKKHCLDYLEICRHYTWSRSWSFMYDTFSEDTFDNTSKWRSGDFLPRRIALIFFLDLSSLQLFAPFSQSHSKR